MLKKCVLIALFLCVTIGSLVAQTKSKCERANILIGVDISSSLTDPDRAQAVDKAKALVSAIDAAFNESSHENWHANMGAFLFAKSISSAIPLFSLEYDWVTSELNSFFEKARTKKVQGTKEDGGDLNTILSFASRVFSSIPDDKSPTSKFYDDQVNLSNVRSILILFTDADFNLEGTIARANTAVAQQDGDPKVKSNARVISAQASRKSDAQISQMVSPYKESMSILIDLLGQNKDETQAKAIESKLPGDSIVEKIKKLMTCQA